MAVIGYAAAAFNVFLDVPVVLRGVSQSLHLTTGAEMRVNSRLLELVEQVDPNDPTGIFDEYFGDWWNFEKDWKNHREVDYLEAFAWHLKKVSEKYAFGLRADFPIGSTG